MLILGIETSCDETSLALVEAEGTALRPKFRVLQNLISSQIAVHAPFGGVVPNLAKREHLKNLPLLWRQFSKKMPKKPDMIAVTVGPGLEPALWTGINFAIELGKELGIPVVGANHMEGHLYSFLLSKKGTSDILTSKDNLPSIALVVSGGHTILLLLKNLKTWKKLGETRDDAAGEAYDKVARILGLPYPGGPEIEKLSKKTKTGVEFPRPMLHDKNYDFSFSGLKTSVLYFVRDNSEAKKEEVAKGFQDAAIDVLAKKSMRALEECGARSLILCGGVAANKTLRARLAKESKKRGVNFFAPDFEFNTDNAAMIAAAGYLAKLRGKRLKLVAKGDMNIL